MTAIAARRSLVAPMRALSEPSPHRIVDARGVELTLDDGTVVLDGTAQGSAAIVGHRHPDLVAALRDAAGGFFVGEGADFGPRARAAEDLLETLSDGTGPYVAARFTQTASEANDLALSLAQAVTGRTALVTRRLSYHGAVGLARDVTTHPLWHGGVAGVSGGWCPAPRGACVRVLDAGDGVPFMRGVDAAVDGAAAVITDFGSGGVYPTTEELAGVGRASRAAGAYWIQDEVVSVFRTGRPLYSLGAGERPDVVTLGKGITAGAAPGGALLLSARAAAALEDARWQTIATFYGHPLTAAAVSATMRIVRREGLVAAAAEKGERLADGLRELRGHPGVRDVAGAGLCWSVGLAAPEGLGSGRWHGEGRGPTPSSVAAAAALAEGVKIAPYDGASLWVTPPLTIEDADVDRLVRALERGAEAVTDAAR